MRIEAEEESGAVLWVFDDYGWCPQDHKVATPSIDPSAQETSRSEMDPLVENRWRRLKLPLLA